MTGDVKCMACNRTVADNGVSAELVGETRWLCAECWGKVARGGREPCQTMEAILLSYAPEFGGADCDCDHEDYRDLELLGLVDLDA